MSVSARNLRAAIVGVLLVLWAGCAWCQNLAIFPKEDILLIGGDFRLRSIHSNMGAADEAGGGESGGFPVSDSSTKSFFDTRLRLYWDFRPSELMRVHYRMEVGDVRFGGCDGNDVDCETGSDVSGNLLPVIGPGAGGGVGADGVNVETKNIFMDMTLPLRTRAELSRRHLRLWRPLRLQHPGRRLCRLAVELPARGHRGASRVPEILRGRYPGQRRRQRLDRH